MESMVFIDGLETFRLLFLFCKWFPSAGGVFQHHIMILQNKLEHIINFRSRIFSTFHRHRMQDFTLRVDSGFKGNPDISWYEARTRGLLHFQTKTRKIRERISESEFLGK